MSRGHLKTISAAKWGNGAVAAAAAAAVAIGLSFYGLVFDDGRLSVWTEGRAGLFDSLAAAGWDHKQSRVVLDIVHPMEGRRLLYDDAADGVAEADHAARGPVESFVKDIMKTIFAWLHLDSGRNLNAEHHFEMARTVHDEAWTNLIKQADEEEREKKDKKRSDPIGEAVLTQVDIGLILDELENGSAENNKLKSDGGNDVSSSVAPSGPSVDSSPPKLDDSFETEADAQLENTNGVLPAAVAEHIDKQSHRPLQQFGANKAIHPHRVTSEDNNEK